MCGLFWISAGQCCSKGSGMRVLFSGVTKRRWRILSSGVMVQSECFRITRAHLNHLCEPAKVKGRQVLSTNLVCALPQDLAREGPCLMVEVEG